MNKIIFKIIALSLVAVSLLTSCSNEESLQQFYVDSSEKDGYFITSIPKTIVGLDASKLTPDSREAYESIDKVSLIALPAKEENKSLLESESKKLDKIFENDKYELLMSHSSDGIKIRMMFDGTQDSIDEIVVYGSSPEMGLGVARIMGDNMNMNKLMAMMQELEGEDMNPAGIKALMGGFGVDIDSAKIDAE